jgi:hypothetical protein
MAQVGIGAFHTVGFALVQQRGISGWAVHQRAVGREAVTVIDAGLRGLVYHLLQHLRRPLCYHRVAHNAMCGAVNGGYDVDRVFFAPTKVWSSSSSTVSLVADAGGVAGSRSAAAATQLLTV